MPVDQDFQTKGLVHKSALGCLLSSWSQVRILPGAPAGGACRGRLTRLMALFEGAASRLGLVETTNWRATLRAKLSFVLSPDNTETPGAGAIEYQTNDHHRVASAGVWIEASRVSLRDE
jgi:hypothetical protein